MRRSELTVAAAAPVVLGVVLGAVGGWLWWTWWGPAPLGRIYDTSAGPHWYPDPFDPGVTRDFSGTAEFVVIAFGLALALGVVSAFVARNGALAGLGALVVGTIAAAALMTAIGLAQSPPDPQAKAEHVKAGTKLPSEKMPGHLEIVGWTPYLAWPVGGLLGFLVVMVSFPVDKGSPRSDKDNLTLAGSPPPVPPSVAPTPQG